MSRAALFCTTDLPHALRLVDAVRQHWPGHDWDVYASLPQHAAIAAAAPNATVLADKPPGSKVAYVLAVRRARYELAIVAWHGQPHPMKAVALLSGARLIVACDENLSMLPLQRGCAGQWITHLARRRRERSFLQRASTMLAKPYRWSVGAVVAVARCAIAARRWRALRGLGQR